MKRHKFITPAILKIINTLSKYSLAPFIRYHNFHSTHIKYVVCPIFRLSDETH